MRRLLGLEDALSLGLAGPTHDKRSWTFDLDPDGVDPVLGIPRLQDAYFARYPDYPRGITVPAVVEVESGKVVTNDFPWITHDFFFEWTDHHREGAPDLWPDATRDEMEEVMHRVFTEVNNGVYRCGFAGSQEAYDSAYDRLWTALDWLEERLTTRRYLMGDTITEADVRLFTTLARFDPVYHGHFKANRQTLATMPALWGYARDLYQTPGFGDATDFEQIKQHYYVVQTDINPTSVVPKGPDLSGWTTAHHREELGGAGAGQRSRPRRRADSTTCVPSSSKRAGTMRIEGPDTDRAPTTPVRETMGAPSELIPVDRPFSLIEYPRSRMATSSARIASGSTSDAGVRGSSGPAR